MLTLNPIRVLGGLLSLAVGAAAFAAPERWATFRSTRGFEVQYPRSWVRIGSGNGLGVSHDRLELRSSRGGATAVVIRPGQAFVDALETSDSLFAAILDTAKLRDYESRVLVRDTVPGTRAAGACPFFDEQVTRGPVIPTRDVRGPVPIEISTALMCRIGDRRFLFGLNYYEGDAKHDAYRAIALRVARSLRVVD